MSSAGAKHHPGGPAWFKSSHSSDEGGNCVEIAACPGTVHIRDSKDPHEPIPTVSLDAWASFVRFANDLG